MKSLKSLVSSIVGVFRSGKAEAALTKAVGLVPRALPIVQAIAEMTPNRTDDEIILAFERYAVPFAGEYVNLPPQDRGFALLKLATSVLARELPGVPTNLLNTAVQLAVTGHKA